MAMPELPIQALALTIRYLRDFGLERIVGSTTSFRPISSNFEMTLSANALHQLEVVFLIMLNIILMYVYMSFIVFFFSF